MRTNLLLLTLILPFSATPAADFNDGVVAHALGRYDKALQTMLALAETADHEYAQYYLGVMYANGQGVKQSYEKAANWLRRSAEKGVPQAQYKLGELYAKGRGVPKDHEHAYAWYSVAAAMGHPSASQSVQLSKGKLSPQELIEADRLSQQFIQKFGKEGGDEKSL